MNTEKFSDSKPVAALAATTLNTGTLTLTGETIDTQFYNSIVVPVDFDWTTDGQIDSILWEESDNASAWSAVPDADSLYYPGSFPIIADALVHVGCVSKKRYVRLKITASAFTSGNIAIPKTAGVLLDSLTKPMVKESSVLADSEVISPGQTADAVTTPPKRT